MADPITTLDEAKDVLARLSTRINSSARLTRTELMDTLAKIYSIRLEKADHARLLEHIIEVRRIEGANRAYLMRTSNPFVLPLRYVFSGAKDRSNVSRYAGALDELRRSQTKTEDFARSVRASGGLVELYWRHRQRSSKRQIRNRLTLDRNIEVVSGQAIMLRLMPNASGIFRVLELAHG